MKKGIDLNTRDGIHETPLYFAAWIGNYESAKKYLKYATNPRAVNSTGVVLHDDLTKRQEHHQLYRLLTQELFSKHGMN